MSRRLKQLYYISHVDNLPSILDHGILSHERIQELEIPFTPIYDSQIVNNRKNRTTPDGKSLWSYANVYFQARNPMLYRVTREVPNDNIAVIALDESAVNISGSFISKGNAASYSSELVSGRKAAEIIRELKPILDLRWWKDEDGSKRKIMAECLVPERVPAELIRGIYVASDSVASTVRTKIQGKLMSARIDVIPEPQIFFGPSLQAQLTRTLSLMKGDMFFSGMQTLTVSVNTVGVMGKGLASRAKYQFPDVYVYYQDACRKKLVKMGKPFLYKREASFDYELADDPQSLRNGNGETWFLLFATKNHWRQDSDFAGIERGMQWLLDNYEKEGIRSLGLPALGCGLGNLRWDRVGPMMCKYLSAMTIPVQLFLPAEHELDSGHLSRDFLLSLTRE